MYADDILLLSPSISGLQELLRVCEIGLRNLDLSINAKKSVCTRIGPRCNTVCSNIVSLNGSIIGWSDVVRYLGVYIVRAKQFKCVFNHAKTSFYRSFNAVYGRIGRAASEEVILQLIFNKCLPCLLYGVDVCPINKSEQRSFDFSLNRVFMKLFRTSSMDIIQSCKYFFSIPDLMDLIRRRKLNFLSKVVSSENISCQLLRDSALSEYTSL